MKEQSVNISLVIQKNKKDICFTILLIVQESLKLKMFSSLRMVKLVGMKIHEIYGD